jgi:uncharacterized membrane protein YeaQ/YmgE (transglycosylase-associated protein family)
VSVLAWIALGLLGGLVCGWLLRARGRSLLADAAVGMVGAILGGFAAAALLGLDVADLEPTSILVAAIGAAVLILVLHTLPSVEIFD